MKMIINKTKEGLEYILEDATIEECINLAKALGSDEPACEVQNVWQVPTKLLIASGKQLDILGEFLNLSRKGRESDTDYRQRLLPLFTHK